ncbi:PID-CTERM protein-sorting domain-containing protein [Marinoscillum sp.]|uniref:PID-CTERM protein-sorting domain-containing protein n=1 Tax=Marinoscillum sp. TaxID=2024838 RepID=UPI003BAC312D
MKNLLYKSLLVLPALLLVLPAFAQPGAPPATPIDGGLSILLAAGGAYGIKKLRDHRKNH